MKKIVVTGGSGGSGRYIVDHLQAHGYDVLNVDRVRLDGQNCPFAKVDLKNYGETFTALHGYEAVVHFGSNPEPDRDFVTGADRFENNTMGTYNVFQAAVALGMKMVVWASSETTFGWPFEQFEPKYLPVDEAHTYPQNSYALSKVVCEELAHRMNVLYGMPFIGLRLSNIHYPGSGFHTHYTNIPSYWNDPKIRMGNLWGYIDARDVAEAVRLSLESGITTAEALTIAAGDTIMNRPSAELAATVFPNVPFKQPVGEFETLLNIDKAKERLGWVPQHSWRTELNEQ